MKINKDLLTVLLLALASKSEELTELKHDVFKYVVNLNFGSFKFKVDFPISESKPDIGKLVKEAIDKALRENALPVEQIKFVKWEVQELYKFRLIANSNFVESALDIWSKYDMSEDEKQLLDAIDHPEWMIRDGLVKTGFNKKGNLIGYVKSTKDWVAIDTDTREIKYSTYEIPKIHNRPISHIVFYEGVEFIN